MSTLYVFSNPWNFKIAVLLLDRWCTYHRTNSSTGKIMCILLSWRNFHIFVTSFPRFNLSTYNISCPNPCKRVHPHLSHMELLLCSLVRDNTVLFKISTPLPWWVFWLHLPLPGPILLNIRELKQRRFWATNVNQKFMFLLWACFHAWPMSHKALISAYSTWLFEWKGCITHQRGEVSTSGWRPWLKKRLCLKCLWSKK